MKKTSQKDRGRYAKGHSQLPACPERINTEFFYNIRESSFVCSAAVISVKNNSRKKSACGNSCQSEKIVLSCGGITKEKKITKDDSGMIGHHNVVAAKEKKHKDAGCINKKFAEESGHIGKSWAKGQNRKDNCHRSKGASHLHSKVCISENHNTEENNNAYDTVFISENFAVSHNKGHAKYHGNKNLKQINKCVMQLFTGGCTAFDK